MELLSQIAAQLNLKLQQVQQTLALLDEGNSVPFITRYRKELTGDLDEEQIRRVLELRDALRGLEERRQAILRSIESQGRLTDELRAALLACERLAELEDLYLPYRPKRKTRASEARRRGLTPLAALLLVSVTGEARWQEELGHVAPLEGEDPALVPDSGPADRPAPLSWDELRRASRDEALAAFLGDEVPGPAEALAGARDILAEWLSERAELRAALRQGGARHAVLQARLKESGPEAAKFSLYHDFHELLRDLPPHRVLALNRGERLGVLQIKLDWQPVRPLERVTGTYLKRPDSPWAADVLEAFADGLERLLLPSLGRELREEKTVEAELHSLEIYAGNLRQLLLQPPLTGRRVLGIDPGFRTGCKVAVVDATGRLLAGATIYPHPPQNKQAEARVMLLELARDHQVDVVAIGNGTAGRETEELVAEWIAENQLSVQWCVVSEAGASVYSASEEAREEFPELDATQRGNISIARRLQDPLAELVKIDPRSLGVGQYQHDVTESRLGGRLDAVVESCVNLVGVDLNTASASLLRHVAGLTRRTSRAVVQWREEHGPFRRREQLREVSGIGPAAFRQCAGFLRIRDGEEALDNTGVHPESYPALRRLFQRCGVSGAQPRELAAAVDAELGGDEARLAALAAELELGVPTLRDILAELRKPGRDPRDELDPPLMRGGILRLEELKPGMVLEGTVRNIVDFGAFVDVGLKTEGLVHVSQLRHERVRHPLDVLRVGERVKAQVLEVDLVRNRLALSLKALLEAPPVPRGHRPEKARSADRERPGGQSPSRPPARPAPGSLAEHLASKRRPGG
ncbi:MAG: Tex family protein [Candidatus Delongbacteria bacterium]